MIIDLISRKHSLNAGCAHRGGSGSPGIWKRHRGHLGILSFPASWVNSSSDRNLQGDEPQGSAAGGLKSTFFLLLFGQVRSC